MKVRDLMTTDVVTVGSDASLKEAARRMIEAGVSGLPVTDDQGRVVGVITEADFVKVESQRRSGARAHLLRWFTSDDEMPDHERHVGDAMTSDVVTLGPDIDHAEAARVMRRAGIKRIPIVGEAGRLVGLVSRSDILRAFVRPDHEILAEIMDHVIAEVLWIDPKRLEVTCEEGNVSLEGRLETRSDAQLLAELVGRLDGVVSVKDNLGWELDNTKTQLTSPAQIGPYW